jgi:hypothetical protein
LAECVAIVWLLEGVVRPGVADQNILTMRSRATVRPLLHACSVREQFASEVRVMAL